VVALAPILEGWINGIQNQVAQDTGMRPNDNGFDDQVESRILTAVKDTEGLVHGFCHRHYYLLAWLPIR